jgi:hypothetical protein
LAGARRDAQSYARAWQAEFGSRLAVGRVLQALMLRPMGLRCGLAVLALVPGAGRWVIAKTRGPELGFGS